MCLPTGTRSYRLKFPLPSTLFTGVHVHRHRPPLASLKRKTDQSAFIAPWIVLSDICVNVTLLQGVPVCVGVNVIRWCLFIYLEPLIKECFSWSEVKATKLTSTCEEWL